MKQNILVFFAILFCANLFSQVRLKQLELGPGAGYVGLTDANGIQVYNLLASLVDPSSTNEAWTITADSGGSELISTQTVDYTGGVGIVTLWEGTGNDLFISLAINELSIDAAPEGDEYLALYDPGGGIHERVLITNLPYLTGDLTTVTDNPNGLDIEEVGNDIRIYLDFSEWSIDAVPEGDEYLLMSEGAGYERIGILDLPYLTDDETGVLDQPNGLDITESFDNILIDYDWTENSIDAAPEGDEYLLMYDNGTYERVAITSVGGSDGNGLWDVTNDGSTIPANMDVNINNTLNFESGLLYIDAVGDEIGIGTINPIANLDITGTDADIQLTATSGAASASIILSNSGDNASWLFQNNATANEFRMGFDSAYPFGSAEAYPLVLTTGGSVGVNMPTGSTTPTQELHITGDMRLTGHIFDSGNSSGTNGQVLTRVSGGTDWQDAAGGSDGNGIFSSSNDGGSVTAASGSYNISLNDNIDFETGLFVINPDDEWVGIRTSSHPGGTLVALSVAGHTNIEQLVRVENTFSGTQSTGLQLQNAVDDNDAWQLYRDGDGDFHIGYDSDSPFLIQDINGLEIDQSGDVSGQHGTYHTSSDRRLKTEIHSIGNALQKVLNLRGVNYKWKDRNKSQRPRMGFIAQEVEKILPDQVNTSGTTGIKSVEYEQMIALLTEAIKEQQLQIDELKRKIK